MELKVDKPYTIFYTKAHSLFSKAGILQVELDSQAALYQQVEATCEEMEFSMKKRFRKGERQNA